MKFGKRLAAEAARRWAPHYLDYKALKRAIKADVASQGACVLRGWLGGVGGSGAGGDAWPSPCQHCT